VAVTPESVCPARKRLGIEPVEMLFLELAAEVMPAPSLFGLRTWGYDGVRFMLPDTPARIRPPSSFGLSAPCLIWLRSTTRIQKPESILTQGDHEASTSNFPLRGTRCRKAAQLRGFWPGLASRAE